MKIFQNKMIVGVICIVVSAVIAFVVLPSFNKNKSLTIKIVQFKENVKAGSKIEESMLTEKEIGSYGLSKNVVKDKSEIIGKYVNTDIFKDDYILSDKISDFNFDKKLDEVMENGKMLISVSIESIAAGVGNHLKAGDRVSLIVFNDDEVLSYEELKNIEIYSIENDEAQSLGEENSEDTKKIISSLTLIVNEAQAAKIVLCEYTGKVHAVLNKRGG